MQAATTDVTVNSTLFGRGPELAALEQMLEDVRRRGAALAIHGDPGIGKSALLDAARTFAEARQMRVLSSAGLESESELPFSGLHRLLLPVLSQVDRLSAQQRSTLIAVFGAGQSAITDLFLVALAALELMSLTAAEVPVLAIVDDLHWLDAASREVIAFISRRIESDAIAILVAMRDGYEQHVGELGIPEHHLQALDPVSAEAVLERRAPDLPSSRRQRLLDEAGGNPLALVELPLAAEADAIPGKDGAALPLTARLEQAFARRLYDMPESAQTLLLLAAADPSSTVSELLAAGQELGPDEVTIADLQPAIDAGLLTLFGANIRLRHPLVRSAVYQVASLERRQAVHHALVNVLGGQPDRRAWHRAAATFSPDDDVAQELEDMAIRARRRGAIVQAAAALARSASITEDIPTRIHRLLDAAELAFELGQADVVRDLVEEAMKLPLKPPDHARALWLSEIFQDGGRGDESRATELVELAAQAKDGAEPDLALKLLEAAALRCWWFGLGPTVRQRLVDTASSVGVADTDPRYLSILSMAEPLKRSAEVISGIAVSEHAAATDPQLAHTLGRAAHAVGDYDTSLRLFGTASDSLRDQGRLALLAQTLVMRTVESTLLGAWSVATASAGEAARLASETNQPIWLAGATASLSALAGLRGEWDEASALAADAEKMLRKTDAASISAWLQVARGLTALSAGEFDQAYTQLVRIFDPSDPAHHLRDQYSGVSLLADAAAGSGRESAARALIALLEQSASVSDAPDVRNGFAYARAVLAPDEAAESLFQSTIAASWTATRPFERARLNLAFGTWLRRQRRVVDSRGPLRLAVSGFDDLRSAPWSERARSEMRAAGAGGTTRRAETWDGLSPQELQIAELAAAGRSNREIGQYLYLSHRTVASHLYRMFPKLGITSRTQLASVLPATGADVAEVPQQ